MAKFDKNIKNEFLKSDEFFDDEEFDDEDADTLDDVDDDMDTEVETNDSEESDTLEYDEAEELHESDSEDEEKNDAVNEEVSVEKSKSSDDDMTPLKNVDGERARWYVVHTYSGHENKVKVNIEKIVENRGMQDLIQCVVMPTEDVVEIKDGQRKVKTRKIFPGYVIVKMVMTSESWYVIRNTQGVTGFVGHGSEPIPLTEEEVHHMGIEKVVVMFDIEVGDNVKVINGPFDSFMGKVEEVNMEKQTVKVRISMFGRETPVELEFDQVEKIS